VVFKYLASRTTPTVLVIVDVLIAHRHEELQAA
jgi:hypothetical protein